MKFSKEDLDSITTWTGCTAAVCLGLASTLASVLSSVPGDKIFGISKVPITVISSVMAGIGATALGVKSVFTNKTATMHPTTADLEQEASIQEQADHFKYSATQAATKSPTSTTLEYPIKEVGQEDTLLWGNKDFDDQP